MKIDLQRLAYSIATIVLSALIVISVTKIIPRSNGFFIFLFLLLAAFTFGSMFGAEIASSIMAIYIIANILGLADFMDGQWGIDSLQSPLAGYKVGFLLVAFMTGIIIPPGRDYNLETLLITFIGTGSLLHFVGIPWLASQSNLQPVVVITDYFIPLLLPHMAATILIMATYKHINKLTL